MVAKKNNMFGGMVPAVDDMLLPDQSAAYSNNTWLYTGSLASLQTPKALHTCALPNCAKVFRIPNNAPDAPHMGDSTWLEFPNSDTDVVRSPVVGDQFSRYYWVSPTSTPQYNTLARIQAGNSGASGPFLLGVPAPTVAPTVTPSGGVSSVTVSRSYVYTWVSAYGEEGPPSPPTVKSGKQDDTWAITALPGDPLLANRSLTKLRIYRTVTASDGTTTYFFVVELPIATTSYNDTPANSDAIITGNNELESTTWSPPPSDLQGWVSMPNGMVAGFRANEVWFCEPYRPHAWPAQYTITVEYPIVGLGVAGTALVITTQSHPYVAYGVHPSTIAQSKLDDIEPCMSRGSILSTTGAVFYASPNGLIGVSPSGVTNMTQALLTKDKWQQLTKVATLRCARLGEAYYAYGSARFGVFQTNAFQVNAFQQQDFTGAFQGVLIDVAQQRIAFNLLSNPVAAINVMNDVWTGEVFIIRNNIVYWLDITDLTVAKEIAIWRSKIFQASKRQNFAAARVFFTVPPSTPPQSSIPNYALAQTLQPGQYALMRLYADGRLVMCRELRTSGELILFPSGFKADLWQFEFETIVVIKSFEVGTSVKDLAGV